MKCTRSAGGRSSPRDHLNGPSRALTKSNGHGDKITQIHECRAFSHLLPGICGEPTSAPPKERLRADCRLPRPGAGPGSRPLPRLLSGKSSRSAQPRGSDTLSHHRWHVSFTENPTEYARSPPELASEWKAAGHTIHTQVSVYTTENSKQL